MIRHLLLAFAALVATPLAAQTLPDAPELAQPGSYAVGVTRLDVADPAQHRTLPLTIWYPATPPAGAAPAHYIVQTPGPVATGGRTGIAVAAAPAIAGKRFPLVVFSHGYRNWAVGFSDLAEGLASHGYVVASIDHRDIEPTSPDSRKLSFAQVLLTRSADQRFVIAELVRRAKTGPLANVYDPSEIALLGYSMGGFGALATAGAGFDPNSTLYKLAPDGLLAPYAEGSPLVAKGAPAGVKAIVAFAPWGGSPPLRAWSEAGLARVTVPTLFVVGDHDDVSGFDGGVHWLYDHLTGADRHMLVYQNAHHNIAGDGIVGIANPGFEMVERLEEPVWRRDRILAINRHFITAFLDGILKHDAAHAAFLAVPTVKADAGTWTLAPGESAGSRYASPADPASRSYWPGFQRRWAMGLELHHATPTGTDRP